MKITELELEGKNKFFDYYIEISNNQNDNVGLHIYSKLYKSMTEKYIKGSLENFHKLLDVIEMCKVKNDLEVYFEPGYPPVIISNHIFAKTEVAYTILIKMLQHYLEKDLRFVVSSKLKNLLIVLKISKTSNVNFNLMINEVKDVFKTN